MTSDDFILNEKSIEIINLLYIFFGDYKKTAAWLHTGNLNIGGSRPIDMILRGREDKLLKWVKTKLSENVR